MIWITVPLLLALQYFGTKDSILPFERNIKSFVVIVVILTLALPCLTYGLDSLAYLMAKLSVRYGVYRRDEDCEANSANNGPMWEEKQSLTKWKVT
jgi:hypothetical protein